MTVGVLQQIESGTPYGAAADIFLFDQDGNDFVQNPGYVNPPVDAVYYFTEPDAFRTAAMYRTDLSLNYQRQFGSATPRLRRVRAVPHPEPVQPVPGVQRRRATTSTRRSRRPSTTPELGLVPFNPFTETPVRGTHWELGEDFGKPTSKDAYTLPRTFRFSVGLRF